MHIDELKRRKIELGYSNEQIAQLTGVPLSTVQKVFAGITQRPRHDTLMALERLLQAPVHFYKEDTVLPKDCHREVVDGIIYEMVSPTSMHHLLKNEMYDAVKGYVKQNSTGGLVGTAPFDVYLPGVRETVVQPDIFVTLDREKISNRGLEGAPEFIIEVVSTETRPKDRGLKLCKYFDAGVREYWLVDLERKIVVVYALVEDYPMGTMYTFDDIIPVGIFNGRCQIDMRAVYAEVAFLEDSAETER